MTAAGNFEGVFASRRGAPAADNWADMAETDASGVFEDVFVRRGRWRKPIALASQEIHSDVVHLAECVASDACDLEYTQPFLSDTSEHKLNILDPLLPSEMTDDMQLVVKNTFLTTAGLVRNSLTKFLSERLVQSCPAGSIDIDDILSADDACGGVELASHDVTMNTALTWQALRTMSFDDASFTLDEFCKGAPFNTASTYEDADVDGLRTMIAEESATGEVTCTHDAVYNTASTLGGDDMSQTIFERSMLNQDKLSTLRMAGANIQQKIAEVSAPLINPPIHLVAMEASFPPPTAALVASVSMMGNPPPPPPFQAAPISSAVLRLAEVLAPPELGGPLAPSIGSLLHHKGECKPCTFFHTRGCQNKEACEFCHLCCPGEKKKRLRAEKSIKRRAEIAAVANARAILASLDAAEANGEVDFIVE